MMTDLRIFRLLDKSGLRGFTCGEREIDRWVAADMPKALEQGRSRIFCLAHRGSPTAFGFYTLAFSLEAQEAASGIRDRAIWLRGVPLLYIGHLAIHKAMQNQSFGRQLLIDALQRACLVSDHVAFYGVGLRSLNPRTTTFYQKLGFGNVGVDGERSNPLMIMPIWTIADLFSQQGFQQ